MYYCFVFAEEDCGVGSQEKLDIFEISHRIVVSFLLSVVFSLFVGSFQNGFNIKKNASDFIRLASRNNGESFFIK